MRTQLFALQALAIALDQIEVAMCVFDAQDDTLLWNQYFLRFFPEHAGHVHEGEPYAENLRRFYRHRLAEDELPAMERYVAAGIKRHREQHAPYEFDHHDFRVRVASIEVGRIGRVRIWRKTVPLLARGDALKTVASVPFQSLSVSPELADALESLADGVLIVDAMDRAQWSNRSFVDMFALPGQSVVVGRTADELYETAWQSHAPTREHAESMATLKERHRFSGAAYELAMPRERWVRVVERRGAAQDGRGYFSYVDITVLKRQQEELRALYQRFESMATTDALTGLANRRRFDEALSAELRRAPRGAAPLALLLIDVDHFKQVNDTYGHQFGDEVLQKIAAVLRFWNRRAGDVAARYGGEEFAMLLPGTDLTSAVAIAESMRQAVERLDVGNTEVGPLTVHISIGASALQAEVAGCDEADLVKRADSALYRAKRGGRNRVEVDVLPDFNG